nr:zinc finger, CCHC-type, retrotransposon Gag domain protein [Tanacetum cinerariifolium]
QTDTETSTEFMQRFLRLAGFLGAATDQVANAARNYEILHERDDDDAERQDKRSSGNGHDQRNRGQQSNRPNTAASTSGQADKKPGASGRVFAITKDHTTKTS